MKIKYIKLWGEAIKQNFVTLNKYTVSKVLTNQLNTSLRKLRKEEQTEIKKTGER